MLSRNQLSCSASEAGESVSRSFGDSCGSSSPKIMLTASREGFGEAVTTPTLCDEDHIPARAAVHVDVPNTTMPRRPRAWYARAEFQRKSRLLDLQAG